MRSIRKFQLLATVIPAILDRMALGDMPTEKTLRIIANASPEEQAAVWKKNKPKRGETISWWAIENALNKSRITASAAAFDDAFAEAYGVVWEDDLFAQPGDPDARTTTRIDAFMAAQHAWMIEKMPTNGVVLDVGEYGNGKLPPKAHEVYGKTTRKDATIGYWVNPRTGAIETKAFIIPVTEKKRAAKSEDAETTVAKSRPAITAKGDAIIGAMRTDALHAALREAPIDDQMLIGLLTLALVSKNVDVRSPGGDRLVKHACVDALTEGGVLTTDPDTLRQTARTMLTHVLSCQQNWSDSGMTARFAGLALNAASYLPNMATQEFLSCLSKAGISAAAEAEGVAPQPTAKATRAALIQHVGEGHFVLPAARFELSESEAAIERERIATERRYATVGRYGTVAGQDDDADDGEAGYQDNDDLPDAEDAGVPDGDIEAAGDGNAPDADGLMQPKEGNDEGAARLAPPPRRNRARNTGIAA